MTDVPELVSRRRALACMAYGSAGTLFTLSGGVLTPIDLARAAAEPGGSPARGRPLLVQLSDTHIGFNKPANPDVAGTLRRAVELVNGLPEQPSLILHTGDITHLSKPAEFDLAQQLLSGLRTSEIHTVPGEHDTSDASVKEYFDRFGGASARRGFYSFDHAGVHFVALVNVLQFKPGGLGSLGTEQLAWAAADLKQRSSSQPIVVFAHMPLWSVYEPWGWGTQDAEPLIAQLRRFGSVTLLNGHIHQIVQKTEGTLHFHTARSTAYPQPAPGEGAGPGPLTVAPDVLRSTLGVTRASLFARTGAITLADASLGENAAQAREILIQGFMFQPTNLTVRVGETVTWINHDDEPHTVASDAGLFRSAALDTGERFAFSFARPGTYRFTCSIHPRMTGMVTVKDNNVA